MTVRRRREATSIHCRFDTPGSGVRQARSSLQSHFSPAAPQVVCYVQQLPPSNLTRCAVEGKLEGVAYYARMDLVVAATRPQEGFLSRKCDGTPQSPLEVKLP